MADEAIAKVLEDDTDAFVEVCEELDNWNGFLGDARCFDMSEIDDVLYGKLPSEVIHMLAPDFDESCDYFYFNGNNYEIQNIYINCKHFL